MLGDCVGMDANYLPTPIPLQLHSVPRLLLKDEQSPQSLFLSL